MKDPLFLYISAEGPHGPIAGEVEIAVDETILQLRSPESLLVSLTDRINKAIGEIHRIDPDARVKEIRGPLPKPWRRKQDNVSPF